jgi:sec-independent protein translocase protein TatB
MFGLSFWEIAIILAVALIFLGPSKLPELARTFGKSLREFRKATDEFRSTIQDEMYQEDKRPAPAARPPQQVAAPVTEAVIEPRPAPDTVAAAAPNAVAAAPVAPAPVAAAAATVAAAPANADKPTG